MECYTCKTELIWVGDNTYEDYGIDDGDGIVSNLTCPNDECSVESVLIYSKA